jgi:hypothetical protein
MLLIFFVVFLSRSFRGLLGRAVAMRLRWSLLLAVLVSSLVLVCEGSEGDDRPRYRCFFTFLSAYELTLLFFNMKIRDSSRSSSLAESV